MQFPDVLQTVRIMPLMDTPNPKVHPLVDALLLHFINITPCIKHFQPYSKLARKLMRRALQIDMRFTVHATHAHYVTHHCALDLRVLCTDVTIFVFKFPGPTARLSRLTKYNPV